MAESGLSAEEVEAAAAAAATAQQAAQTAVADPAAAAAAAKQAVKTAVADPAPVAAKTLGLMKRAAYEADESGLTAAAVEHVALPLSAKVGGRVGGSASCEGRLFTQRAASTGRRACRKVCEDRCSPRRPSLKPPLGQLAAAARELAAAAAAEVDTQVAPAIEVPSTLLPASLRHDDGTTTVLCDLTLADGGEQRAWGG